MASWPKGTKVSLSKGSHSTTIKKSQIHAETHARSQCKVWTDFIQLSLKGTLYVPFKEKGHFCGFNSKIISCLAKYLHARRKNKILLTHAEKGRQKLKCPYPKQNKFSEWNVVAGNELTSCHPRPKHWFGLNQKQPKGTLFEGHWGLWRG